LRAYIVPPAHTVGDDALVLHREVAFGHAVHQPLELHVVVERRDGLPTARGLAATCCSRGPPLNEFA
jgi:hypothetical protein